MDCGGQRGKRLRDRAKFRFGPDSARCQQCKACGLACAEGGRDPDNRRCPARSNPPLSATGRLAEEIAASPGVWRRLGDAGVLTGLEWAAVGMLMPDLEPSDRRMVIACLKIIEGAALEGDMARLEAQRSNRGSGISVIYGDA